MSLSKLLLFKPFLCLFIFQKPCTSFCLHKTFSKIFSVILSYNFSSALHPTLSFLLQFSSLSLDNICAPSAVIKWTFTSFQTSMSLYPTEIMILKVSKQMLTCETDHATFVFLDPVNFTLIISF